MLFTLNRIKNETFDYLKRQSQELFPTEAASLFYTPSYKNPVTNQAVGPSGCYYNYYKTTRKLLREAKIIDDGKEDDTNTSHAESDNVDIRQSKFSLYLFIILLIT